MRRLARITAPTTQRRVITPTSAVHDKENVDVDELDQGDEGNVKKPQINFSIEESIEEGDSEIPVAPTPSALLEGTDDEGEQPTITFQNLCDGSRQSGSRLALVPQSDSALPEEGEENDDEGNSTFLSERGRRAVSEEPTRMSRYSFGSIRMSEFGTELEMRRESDRQQKLTALEVDDDYGDGMSIQLGGETGDLRNLRQSSPEHTALIEQDSMHAPAEHNETFQFDVLEEDEEAEAHQRLQTTEQPQLADTLLQDDMSNDDDQAYEDVEDDDEVAEEGEEVADEAIATAPSASSSRLQTLLESAATAAAKRPRKKQKLNHRGNMVPALPSSLIKRVVHDSQEKANKRKTTLGKDHMKALEQATEWFFEQVSEDLEAYSSHGKRKKRIDADDVLLLMRRQKVLCEAGSLRKLAKEWLPREMLNELDLPDRL